MRKLNLLTILFIISFLFPSIITAQNKYNIEGSWHGVLKTSGIELRIVFNFTKADDGTYTATMDSPDQQAKDIPVETVTLKEDKIKIEVTVAQGEYNGSINEESTKFEGIWTQVGRDFPLILEKK